jgi:hypothetical protein
MMTDAELLAEIESAIADAKARAAFLDEICDKTIAWVKQSETLMRDCRELKSAYLQMAKRERFRAEMLKERMGANDSDWWKSGGEDQ